MNANKRYGGGKTSDQARIQTDATDASASVKIFMITRTRIVNILLKYI
jgi:hypothetical protein